MEGWKDFSAAGVWYYPYLFVRLLTHATSVPISELLNTDMEFESPQSQVDVRHHIASISDLLLRPSLCAPPHIAEYLLDVVNYFSSDNYPTERSTHTPQVHIPLLTSIRQPPLLGPLNTQYNIKLNRKTTLSTLYVYKDSNVYVEYPDTHPNHPVGYLSLWLAGSYP